MKHYSVIAELVDDTTGKRFMPGEMFVPASEKQRQRLTVAGCLDETGVDALDDLADLPLGSLTREHLENIAAEIARQSIASASDEQLRDGIAAYRAGQVAAFGDPASEAGPDTPGPAGGDHHDGDDLDDRTVEQLKAVAGDETVDLTGKTLKADIITAIRAHRGTSTIKA